ncbi:MAG: hypothetical protein IJ644_10435 [Oscillospiraceae bacterium]|nr:hypothetical protein [Oscillospiraceae bacterium]
MKQTENINLPAVPSEPPEQKTKVFAVIAQILTVVIVLITILHCIAIAVSSVRIIISVICILFWIFCRKAKFSKLFCLITVLASFYMGFLCMIPPFIFNSNQLWKYPVQKFYIDLYQNIKEPDFFPDFTEDVISGYDFDYMPSILQGAGHYSVAFVTTPEKAKAYQELYSRQAEYIIPLNELHDTSYHPDDKEEDDTIDFFISTIWEESSLGEFETEKNAEVYVLSSNGDWNHPHTSAVIIDTSSGRIQFSKLG